MLRPAQSSDAWIDFDGDQTWSPGEQIADSVDVTNGDNAITFAIPAAAQLGTTIARFRVSEDGDLEPTGLGENGEVEDHEVTIDNDLQAPKISQVRVGSIHWQPAFESEVDPGVGLGYVIPDGASQLDPLPWVNVNQIRITFNEHVIVQREDFMLVGVNVPAYSLLPGSGIPDTTGFHYDQATLTATWTLDTDIGVDKLLVLVSDAITDAFGNSLDGEWMNGVTSGSSGDDTSGGDFEYRFDILHGDVNQTATVFSDDVILVRDSQFIFPGNPLFDPLVDIDGSGTIFSDDVIGVRDGQFVFLPDDEPSGEFLRLPSEMLAYGLPYPSDLSAPTANDLESARALATEYWKTWGASPEQLSQLEHAEVRLINLSHGRARIDDEERRAYRRRRFRTGWTLPGDRRDSPHESHAGAVDLLTVIVHELDTSLVCPITRTRTP